MKVLVEIKDSTLQSYLDNYNDLTGRDVKVADLTDEQMTAIAKEFADEMAGEMVMRTDDHSGFETERLIIPALGE